MENKKSFGNFIYQRRKDLGFTQKEFAQRLFVTDSAVSKWERGLAYPDITLLQEICQVLQCSEKELLTASEDQEGRRADLLAKKYLRLTRTYRLIQYLLYGLITAGCLLGNLLGQHTLSWFWIVVAAELVAASLTLLPVFAPEGWRGLWSLGSFTLSLILLLLICCLYTGGDWFLVAAVGVLFGMGLIFLPFVLRSFPLPEGLSDRKALLYILGELFLLLCLLGACCLYTGGDWFLVAAAGVLFGTGLVFLPLVLRSLPLPEKLSNRKALLYVLGELLLLLCLFGGSCLYTGGNWFLSASLWTVFGLSIPLLPPLMKQIPLPLRWRSHKALVYFSFETVLLLVGLAYQGWGTFFPVPALPLALLCLALPWGWMAALRYLPLNRWFRLGTGFGWTALWLWLAPWSLDQILLRSNQISSHPYQLLLPVDFTRWTGDALTANVTLFILLGLILLAALCTILGIRRARTGHR